MRRSTDSTRTLALTCILAIVLLALASALAQQKGWLTIDEVMTAQEMKDTGVTTLSASQRQQLDRWLNRYTTLLLSSRKAAGDNCDPAIEAQIDGAFHGWDGETIYKLRNGQIWQQASYHYHYHYAYAPEVIIYPSGGGCFMLVKGDDDEPIPVGRIK